MSQDAFEVSHNILNQYTAQYAFYQLLFLCGICDFFKILTS